MKTLRKKSCLLTKNLSPDQPEGDQEPKTKRKKPAGISPMTIIITILLFTKLIIMMSVALVMKVVIWKSV